MTFEVTRQETYSRGELLLRFFLGGLYILLPHAFLLMFLGIWGMILNFITFWVILFTGSFPESFFDFQLKLMRWSTRVNLRLYNLADGYPGFGLDAEDDAFKLEMACPENSSRGLALLRFFFAWLYLLIPHGFVLYFRSLWTGILSLLAFFSVLFTGEYPESWFDFNVGTLRWNLRVNQYWLYMTDEYPPFSGN